MVCSVLKTGSGGRQETLRRQRFLHYVSEDYAWLRLITLKRKAPRQTEKVIRQLNRGLLQKTQTSKLPNLTTCTRTPFWSFCAEQRRIGPGQITDEA